MSYLCDFCNSSVLSARDGITVKGKQVNSVIQGKSGSIGITHDADWLACQDCAKLISQGDWDTLMKRVLGYLGVEDPAFDLALRMTYSEAFGLHGLVERAPFFLLNLKSASSFRM